MGDSINPETYIWKFFSCGLVKTSSNHGVADVTIDGNSTIGIMFPPQWSVGTPELKAFRPEKNLSRAQNSGICQSLVIYCGKQSNVYCRLHMHVTLLQTTNKFGQMQAFAKRPSCFFTFKRAGR